MISTLGDYMSAKHQDIVENTKRVFGPIDFEVSALSFGGAAVSGEGGGYGFGDISEKDSVELIRYAYDLGINLFDSAPIYGFGTSEVRIGKALKDVREKVFYVSKSGVDWHDNMRVNMSNDPKITEKMLLESLKRMDTEYLDLYFIHWPDENVDIRKPLEVLSKYKEKGVIRHIGLCNTSLDDLSKAKEIDKIDVVQSEYNMFMRGVEQEILPYCEENGIAFMSWGTLEKGILTGKYDLNASRNDSDARKSAPWWNKKDVTKKVELVDKTKKYLEETDFLYRDLAVNFNLKNKSLTTILAGPRNKNQLETLIESIGVNTDDFAYWDEILSTLREFHA